MGRVKHWTKYSVYAIAVALCKQHEFDPDIAFQCAWYALKANKQPPMSMYQILSRMSRVKHIPSISEAGMRVMLGNAAWHKKIYQFQIWREPPRELAMSQKQG